MNEMLHPMNPPPIFMDHKFEGQVMSNKHGTALQCPKSIDFNTTHAQLEVLIAASFDPHYLPIHNFVPFCVGLVSVISEWKNA